MYFEFSAFYKRDAAFTFSQERNRMKLFDLRTGQPLNIDKPLEFEVDKIDRDIESYDLLPTYDAPLVSARFKDIFNNLIDDIQFVNARIIDRMNNINDSFYYVNILNVLPIMDKIRSVFEEEIDENESYLSIKKLYIVDGGLKGYSIVRMKEHDSYIIVTEEFKKRCEDAQLKGLHFTEEGYSIYTNPD